MIIEIPGFLNPNEVGFLRELFTDLPEREGAQTAGEALGQSKRNAELALGERAAQVRELVFGACNRTPGISLVILPKFVTAPILSRYGPGMFYGTHTDAAFGQENGSVYRTDFSCTIFLDEPSSYTGGELSVQTDVGVHAYKLPPGGAVFYPTLYDHEVRAVTRGTRRACVFWVESLIRDPLKRRILLDMVQVGEWMGQTQPIDSEPRRAIIRARENLLRMWLES